MSGTITFFHGVQTREIATGMEPTRHTTAGVPFVVGTAPIHRAAGKANKIYIFHDLATAIETLGYSDDWKSYTLCEVMYVFFKLYSIGPIICVCVNDPATHKKSVADETKQFGADNTLTTDNPEILPDTLVLKNSAGDTTYTRDVDYELNEATGKITRLEDGGIVALSQVALAYDHADPDAVTAADIVGGLDQETGKRTGWELIEEVYAETTETPGVFICPRYGQDPVVANVMIGKAENYDVVFHAGAVILDLPGAQVPKYLDAPGYKTSQSYTEPHVLPVWPPVCHIKGTDFDQQFCASSHVAAIMADTDHKHDDLPSHSPSNKIMRINAVSVDGSEELNINRSAANHLNGNGIMTLQKRKGGWRTWGPFTGCYPAIKDPKDAHINLRRMTAWYRNHLTLMWEDVVTGDNITRRMVQRVLLSAQEELNAWTAAEVILGGKILFLEAENPTVNLMAGNIAFHVFWTPPPTAVNIEFLVEWDPSNLVRLFSRAA